MSHNDGMPQRLDVIPKNLELETHLNYPEASKCYAWGYNACHDAFTKYLAERKTLEESTKDQLLKERQRTIELQMKTIAKLNAERKAMGKHESGSILEGLCDYLAPPTEKNTPEKKLVELDSLKLLEVLDEADKVSIKKFGGKYIRNCQVDLIRQTFGIPERRVPTKKEAISIMDKIGRTDKKEGGTSIHCSDYGKVYDALIDKKEN